MQTKQAHNSFILVSLLSLMILPISTEICTKTICEYTFDIRETLSMVYRLDVDHAYQVQVANDGTLKLQPNSFYRTVPDIKVPQDKVHTVDGYNKTIITINDQFPGPTIEVLEGSEVVVTVINNLLKEDTAIHWHGIHMRQHPWMDGVPFVTQCPIPTKRSFQYRFIADPPGTHWYHSHLEMQKADGLFGAMIIHRSLPTVPYYVMTFNDWFRHHSTDIEISSPLRVHNKGSGYMFYADKERSFMFDGTLEGPIQYWSGLINGKGRHNNSAPLSVFPVKDGKKYVLHMINTGLAYPYRISIDNHTLTVTESDGHRVKPVQVDYAIIFPGESYNFEITANQEPGRYWIRAINMRTGIGLDSPPDEEVWEATAILEYADSPSSGDPTSQDKDCTADAPCVVLNCPWSVYSKVWYAHQTCIPVSKLSLDTSFYDPEKVPSTKDDKDVHEVFLNFGFPKGAAVNSRRLVLPRAPLVQSPSTWGITPCSRACDKEVCACTNVVDLPAKKTIQVVLMAYSGAKLGHPVHIHGHSFQILKIGFPVQNQTTGKIIQANPDITCENRHCSLSRWSAGMPKDLNFNDPPLKDTVIVPSYGYVVVRFISDNPGYWLTHCHVGNHLAEGMGMIFNESFSHQPPAPPGFPACNEFAQDHDSFNSYLKQNKECLEDSSHCTRLSSQEGKPRRAHDCQDTWPYVVIACCAIICAVLALVVNVIMWCYLRKNTGSSAKKVMLNGHNEKL